MANVSPDPSTYPTGTTPTGSEQVLANQSGSLVSLTATQLTQLSYNSIGLWKTYDTVAQMKAGANAAYPRVKWRGYNYAGDGGGGEGVFVTGNYTPDEGSIFAVTAGGYVVREVPHADVNVLVFGAYGDGSSDDTSAIRRADALATALGKRVYFPATANGYVVTERIDINSRGVVGDVGYIDGGQRGVVINFRPNATLSTGTTAPAYTPTASTGDNYSCFRFHAKNIINFGVTIFGQTPYAITTLVSAGYLPSGWKWSATLNYADLGLGFVGFEMAGSSTGRFDSCFTQNLKHGLLLNSTNGHIRWYNCAFKGLVGVMCYRNSGDYYMEGGSLEGIMAGFGFNDLLQAGHYGGTQFTLMQAHGGFGLSAIAQFHDASTPAGVAPAGIDGTFVEFHMEQIGQIGIQMLPGANNGIKFIGSSIGFATAIAGSDAGWAFILPAALAPAEGVQQYAMRLGAVSILNASGSIFGPTNTTVANCSYVASNPRALHIDGIANGANQQDPLDFSAWGYDVQIGDGSDNTFSNPAIKFLAAPRPTFELSPYKATKGDLRRITSVRSQKNLLQNWEFQTAGLGSTNNALRANGGNLTTSDASSTSLTIYPLSALIASGEITEAMIPTSAREFLGKDPFVLKALCTAAGTVSFFVPTLDSPAIVPRRMISLSAFVMGKSAGSGAATSRFASRVQGGSNTYPAYTTTIQKVNQFMHLDCADFASGAPGSANNQYYGIQCFSEKLTAGDALYVMGIMLNEGPPAAYNPHPVASVGGPLYTDGMIATPTRLYTVTSSSPSSPVAKADSTIKFNCSAYAGVALLDAAPIHGQTHRIKKTDVANQLAINPNGNKIEGGTANVVIAAATKGFVTVQWDAYAAEWSVIG